MEDAYRVFPRACLLRLLRVSVRFSQSPRTQPMPTNSPRSWSIFDRRLCVSGALFFFWRRAGGAFWGNLVVGDGRCLSSVPTRLSVAAAMCFCSCFAIIAHSAHANEQSPILVDFRSPFRFRCLGCSSLLLVGRLWRVLGKFGRWRRKMLVVCARPRLFVVAVACCCLSELPFNLPVPMSAPNPGRFRSSFRCLGCVSLLLVAFWDMWISTNFVPDCRHHM